MSLAHVSADFPQWEGEWRVRLTENGPGGKVKTEYQCSYDDFPVKKVLAGAHMLIFPFPKEDGKLNKYAKVFLDTKDSGELTVKWGLSSWGKEQFSLTDLRPRPRTIKFAKPLVRVQQYKEDNRSLWKIETSENNYCGIAFNEYVMPRPMPAIPLIGEVSWANIPNLAATIIREQNAPVSDDFMIRYLTNHFYKKELNTQLDKVTDARRKTWRRLDGTAVHLQQWPKITDPFSEGAYRRKVRYQHFDASAKSRVPARAKITDPRAEQRNRWAAEGWTVAPGRNPSRYSKRMERLAKQTRIKGGILKFSEL